MTPRIILLLIGSAALAASGQVLFKLGATGRHTLMAFLNPWILVGLVAYGLSTAIWIYSLSKAPLTSVYPFTALTFVLAYFLGAIVLREPLALGALFGVMLILSGLFFVVRG